MKHEGQLRVCDRCGKSAFFKLLGETVLDGGYTRRNNFEKAEGWDTLHGVGDLCPECSAEWEELKRIFVKVATDEKIPS